MKNIKRIIVSLTATAAITVSMATTAFAAPATTTTSTCPKTQVLQQLLSQKGISMPANLSSANLQQLLSKLGISLSTTKTTVKTTTAPKTTPAPTATSAPKSTPAPTATSAPKATTAPSATPAPTTKPASGSMSADESKMIDLVNQDRAANGLKPLTFDASLRAAALDHSQDMSANNYFSHTSPTKGTFSDRLKASGVKYASAGENIAKYGSVEAAEIGFMNSAGHRANILGDYTRVGIGIVYNQGTYYITQWFAK